jgi:hypothetical protein
MFLGRTSNSDQQGETAVYFFDKFYNCSPITPFSITSFINNNQFNFEDAYAYSSTTKDGHSWYHLTIPALKTTFVYDFFTKQWFERQSIAPYNDVNGDQVIREFRGRTHTTFNGKNLYGDLYSGKIFVEDYSTFTENSQSIIRTRISQTFNEEYKNISVYHLEIDGTPGYGTTSGQGVNPILNIQYSNDGGYNYKAPRPMFLGPLGNHVNRIRLNKLGTERNWTLKITWSDPIDFALLNAYAQGVVDEF